MLTGSDFPGGCWPIYGCEAAGFGRLSSGGAACRPPARVPIVQPARHPPRRGAMRVEWALGGRARRVAGVWGVGGSGRTLWGRAKTSVAALSAAHGAPHLATGHRSTIIAKDEDG